MSGWWLRFAAPVLLLVIWRVAIWLAPVTTRGKIEWVFLVPLLLGILAAVATLASFLENQLEERPTVLAGVFLGLVLGSVAIAWRLIKQPNTMHVVIVALAGLALFVVLGLGEGSAIADPSPLAFVGAGGLWRSAP